MAVPPTSAGAEVGSSTVRWSILGALLGLTLLALIGAFVTVELHGAGGDPLDRLQSMRHPAPDPALAREQALGAAQDFVTHFNSYGPDLLAKDGTMPKYDQLTDSMTSKLAAVFSKQSPMAAATVKQTHVRSVGQVYAAGISSMDEDTATAIVGGTATFGYPNPNKKGAWLDSDPQRFRYVVSLVEQHGRWLVDDMDNLDDNLPSFGTSGEQAPGGAGGQAPSTPSATAPAPSATGTAGGGR